MIFDIQRVGYFGQRAGRETGDRVGTFSKTGKRLHTVTPVILGNCLGSSRATEFTFDYHTGSILRGV